MIKKKKLLLFLSNYDPINNSILTLIDHASKELNIFEAAFIYDNPLEKEDILKTEEKLLLINAAIEKKSTLKYIIDGASFEHKRNYFVDKIIAFINSNVDYQVYWLITREQYLIYSESDYFLKLSSMINIILYLTQTETLDELNIKNVNLSYISSHPDIKTFDDSIYIMDKNSFHPTIIEYINASVECAIKRIKFLEKPERFAHSIRVAGTILRICELNNIEDENFKFKCYMAAIYHDLAKNFDPKELKKMYTENIGEINNLSTKVLHGPVGAWYLKNYYFFTDEEIILTISEHTKPVTIPVSQLTKYLYLADKLELEKEPKYNFEEYKGYWKLIAERKIDEAFNKLLSKTDQAIKTL